MKKISILILLVVLISSFVYAHGDSFEGIEQLIGDKVSCEELSEEQLESIGDYYMEQMHPGEAHVRMDEMMSGEGSGSLKQMHINMAKNLYCGENVGMMGTGMMNMMGGGKMMGYGMMGTGSGFGYWGFMNLLYVILVIGLIILVYLWIMKLWKSMQGNKNKKTK